MFHQDHVQQMSGFFIEYYERSYYQKLQVKRVEFSRKEGTHLVEHRMTLPVRDLSPFKIDISLKMQDYERAKLGLVDLLLKHLGMGSFSCFSVLNTEELGQFLSVNTDARDYFDTTKIIIHVPAAFTFIALKQCCVDLDDYLSHGCFACGPVLDTEIALSRHLRLRKEYAEDDFERIKRAGVEISGLRIPEFSALFSGEEAVRLRLHSVIQEQLESRLYRELRNEASRELDVYLHKKDLEMSQQPFFKATEKLRVLFGHSTKTEKVRVAEKLGRYLQGESVDLTEEELATMSKKKLGQLVRKHQSRFLCLTSSSS